MEKYENKNMILAEKSTGETMGQLRQRVFSELSLDPNTKLTFAGRLDPLASGVVVFLLNERRFQKDEFLSLNKSYSFQIILGLKTDTGDPLGLIECVDFSRKIEEAEVINTLKKFESKYRQKYPKFSSRKVDGRALFEHTRNQNEVKIPDHEIEIFALSLQKTREIKKEDLLDNIFTLIRKVEGDFRQEKIIKRWQEIEDDIPNKVQVLDCNVECSSGTYVRVLTEDIAKELNTVATTQNIHRSKIGHLQTK
ncbi:MAG: hypothetical protein U5L75_02330 [Candidatus Campbellbacteria bacterium]|nr:hypothetical protein [Candidatus Campbellbacteria bacterium]